MSGLVSKSVAPVAVASPSAGTNLGIAAWIGRILRFSLWIPGREYNHRLLCPACNKRSWTRIRLM